MIKLYGTPVSNYYSMVVVALLEKKLAYEEILQRPSQEEDYLKISPMGKIPAIEVGEGYLSETLAILEFLEDAQPDISLLPSDPYRKAKCRELMRIAELYIELPTHSVGFSALLKQQLPEQAIAKACQSAARGYAALARLSDCTPYLLGEQFSYADIVLYYSMVWNKLLASLNEQWSPFALVPGLADWHQRISERDTVRTVNEAQQKATEAFLLQVASTR